MPAYLCESCGSPTLGCAGPGCANMATRGFAAVLVPRYCAEHRHEIPGFEKASASFGVLEDYHEFLNFERRNLALGSRVATISVLTAGALATGAFFAAPAIGGAIGSLSVAGGGGYAGAAASSYGLALLGGGSIAAGGLGMAGGTAVVAAVGGALGGALGSSVTTAYIGADKSFNIELIKPGSGIAVIVANGLFSEGTDTRKDWKKLVAQRYPDSPIYRVHWGSNDLGDLAAMVKALGGQPAAALGVKGLAAKAGKAGAKKLGPLAPALAMAAIAKNPWHTAKVKADRTGVALAGLLARTDAQSYVLVGHSLGARVAATAAETLATSKSRPKIDTVHLLGAAVGSKVTGDCSATQSPVQCTTTTHRTTVSSSSPTRPPKADKRRSDSLASAPNSPASTTTTSPLVSLAIRSISKTCSSTDRAVLPGCRRGHPQALLQMPAPYGRWPRGRPSECARDGTCGPSTTGILLFVALFLVDLLALRVGYVLYDRDRQRPQPRGRPQVLGPGSAHGRRRRVPARPQASLARPQRREGLDLFQGGRTVALPAACQVYLT